MPKRPPERVTRLGLPEKSARINLAVTPKEKAEMQEAARSRRMTLTDYLLQLHRSDVKKGGK